MEFICHVPKQASRLSAETSTVYFVKANIVGHMHRSIRGLPATFAFQLILSHFLMLNPMVPTDF